MILIQFSWNILISYLRFRYYFDAFFFLYRIVHTGRSSGLCIFKTVIIFNDKNQIVIKFLAGPSIKKIGRLLFTHSGIAFARINTVRMYFVVCRQHTFECKQRSGFIYFFTDSHLRQQVCFAVLTFVINVSFCCILPL